MINRMTNVTIHLKARGLAKCDSRIQHRAPNRKGVNNRNLKKQNK